MAKGSKCIAYELLVRERAIDLRGVEERHAEVHRVPDQRDRLVPGQGGAAVITQAHAAKPERRYLQPAGPQRPDLQGVIHAAIEPRLTGGGNDAVRSSEVPEAALVVMLPLALLVFVDAVDADRDRDDQRVVDALLDLHPV